MTEYVRCGGEILKRQVEEEWGVTYYDNHSKYHRLDGPAFIRPDGTYMWYLHGKKHRVGGPAFYKDEGCQQWWQNDYLHRLDGPAVFTIGSETWHIYGNVIKDPLIKIKQLQRLNALLKLTISQNKSRKFNEWLFDPDHYAGQWHKKNMLRDFQTS